MVLRTLVDYYLLFSYFCLTLGMGVVLADYYWRKLSFLKALALLALLLFGKLLIILLMWVEYAYLGLNK